MPISSDTILKQTHKAQFNQFEQSIIHALKTLPSNPWNNQDVLQLINTCRLKSVNPGRINENEYIKAPKATAEVIKLYIEIQNAWDLKTKLNPYHHERLVSAREAMIQAVQVFNNPSMHFKTQSFAVSAIIAWTYLFHQKYLSEGETIHKTDGKTKSLSFLIGENKYDVAEAIRANIEFMIETRNSIEHELLGQIDTCLQSKFQACAVNFNTMLKQWFGNHMDLAEHLSFAVQFANLSTQQLNQIQMQELPETIKAIDINLAKKYSPEALLSKAYDFTVYYGQTLGAKSTAGQTFFADGSEGDKAISNIVIKKQPSDKSHPFTAANVKDEINKKIHPKINQTMHTNAWKLYDVRPSGNDDEPQKTKQEYCYYDTTFKSYRYSQEWIDFLVAELSVPAKLKAVKEFKQ